MNKKEQIKKAFNKFLGENNVTTHNVCSIKFVNVDSLLDTTGELDHMPYKIMEFGFGKGQYRLMSEPQCANVLLKNKIEPFYSEVKDVLSEKELKYGFRESDLSYLCSYSTPYKYNDYCSYDFHIYEDSGDEMERFGLLPKSRKELILKSLIGSSLKEYKLKSVRNDGYVVATRSFYDIDELDEKFGIFEKSDLTFASEKAMYFNDLDSKTQALWISTFIDGISVEKRNFVNVDVAFVLLMGTPKVREKIMQVLCDTKKIHSDIFTISEVFFQLIDSACSDDVIKVVKDELEEDFDDIDEFEDFDEFDIPTMSVDEMSDEEYADSISLMDFNDFE